LWRSTSADRGKYRAYHWAGHRDLSQFEGDGACVAAKAGAPRRISVVRAGRSDRPLSAEAVI
jgi:hypothetical protein